MPLSRRRGIALLVLCAGAAAVVWPPRAHDPDPAGPRAVVRRPSQALEGRSGLGPDEPGAAAALASSARHRWTAEQIAATWTTASTGAGVALRSPRLDLASPEDLYAIVVTLAASARAIDRAVLLWSSRPTLSPEEYLRARRDLHLQDDGSRIAIINGKNIRGDAREPVRYLFLHVPDEPDELAIERLIESVAVAETADLAAVPTPREARVMLDGEVRQAVPGTGRDVIYAVDAPAHAELLFGLRVPDGTTAHARAVVAVDGRKTTVFDQTVEGGAWRDFRADLPAGEGAIVAFSATPASSDQPVYWSAPLVLAAADAVDRPNIVLYVVDTLRADALGVYGAEPTVSPVLDDFGGRGLVFRRAYAAASWTKPSVTSLLTSLHPETHGLGARYYSDPLPDAVPTLQSVLQTHGYLTGLFSANAFAGTLSNLDRGFDRAVMPPAFRPAVEQTPTKVRADELHARVLPWVERHARDRFFLYVQSMDVHPPYVLPARDGSGDLRARYDAAVTFNDREIGRLHQRLVDLGLASRTLFIVTADHGEAFGDHGQSGHGLSVYDEEVRVPLLLHWPGRIAPGWVEEPVSLVDLLPTILDYAGIAFEEGMFQGRSLMRLDASAVPRPVFSRRFVYPEDLDAAGGGRHESRAVVMYPWKLTATDTSDGGRRFELFDLEADPREGRDVSASEQGRVHSMEAVLQGFLDEQRHARARFLAASAGGTAAQTPRRQLPDNVLQQLRSLGYIK